MAYTGVVIGSIDEFYKYLNELYGRPVFTHEIPGLDIEERSKQDFINIHIEG